MNNNSFRCRGIAYLSWICLAFICYANGLASAEDFLSKSSLAEVLPETTQLVFTSQNVQTSYLALERSDVCKQLEGSLWQPVITKQKAAKVGSLLRPQPWLGLDWQDIRSIDQAGAVAAFLDSDGETAIVFLANLGPDAEKHPFVQRWIANQGGMSQLQSFPTIGKSKFYAVKGDGKSGESACLALGSQWICISSSAKAVQQWLGSPTLKSMQATAPPGLAQNAFASGNWMNGETRFWLSPWAILSGYSKKDPKLFRSAKLFGLEGLRTMSGTLLPPSSDDSSWRVNYSLQLSNPPSKGLAILSFKTGPMVDPPKILNESMDQVSISYLDMKPWFQGVSHAADQLIDEETPGSFADLIDSILTDPEGPKVDVRKELIYPSGPLMFSLGVTNPDKKIVGQLLHNQVWVCKLQDAKRALATVNKLFENDEDIQSESIGPYRVWNTKNDESLFVAVSKGETQSISIAAIDSTYIYLSTDTTWLKGLLSGTGPTKTTNRKPPALWNAHLPKLKSPAFSFQQAIDLGSWFERSWARLPEPTHKEFSSVDLPSFCLTNVLVPGCTGADIPKWSQVQSAFGILTQTAIQNERGIEGKIFLYANP